MTVLHHEESVFIPFNFKYNVYLVFSFLLIAYAP